MDRDLASEEFRHFHDLIHRLTGIHYPEDKLQLLSNRLRKRMRLCRVDSYAAYLKHIQDTRQRAELQQFIDSITTNETYFFRCQRHWDLFAEWARNFAKRRPPSLRIWSAAASNGSEAGTIMIVLDQTLGRGFGGLKVEVLATDLSNSVLADARAGVYRSYAVSQTPPEVVANYFQRLDDDRLRLDPRLHSHITFRAHNLMEPLGGPPFDFVFLRNVMIYFDRPSKERVLANVDGVLRPGGMLVVGEAESLLNIRHSLTYLQPSWFQKPPSAPTPARR